MKQNNTLNKVHIAATELPQLLLENTNMFEKATAQRCCAVRLCAALKLTEKNKLLQFDGGARAPVPHG